MNDLHNASIIAANLINEENALGTCPAYVEHALRASGALTFSVVGGYQTWDWPLAVATMRVVVADMAAARAEVAAL